MRAAAARNILKVLVLFLLFCGLAGGLGWLLGELRLLSLFVFAASLVAATFWAYGDRFVLGMTGARELPVGESPALHSTVERLAAVLRIVKPKVCILRDGHPLEFVNPLVRDAIHADVPTGERALLVERLNRRLKSSSSPADHAEAPR